jgi:hypothetical protein
LITHLFFCGGSGTRIIGSGTRIIFCERFRTNMNIECGAEEEDDENEDEE